MKNNVEEYRKKRGLTQSELGRRVGVKPSFIHQIERQKKEPSLKTASKLLQALECSFRDLFQEVAEFLEANGLPPDPTPSLFPPETTNDTQDPTNPLKTPAKALPDE